MIQTVVSVELPVDENSGSRRTGLVLWIRMERKNGLRLLREPMEMSWKDSWSVMN